MKNYFLHEAVFHDLDGHDHSHGHHVDCEQQQDDAEENDILEYLLEHIAKEEREQQEEQSEEEDGEKKPGNDGDEKGFISSKSRGSTVTAIRGSKAGGSNSQEPQPDSGPSQPAEGDGGGAGGGGGVEGGDNQMETSATGTSGTDIMERTILETNQDNRFRAGPSII